MGGGVFWLVDDPKDPFFALMTANLGRELAESRLLDLLAEDRTCFEFVEGGRSLAMALAELTLLD